MLRIRISSIWWILVNWWLQLRCLMPRRRIARSRRNFGGAGHPRPLLLQGQRHHPRNHSRCRCRTPPCRSRPCRCQCHNLCCPGSWRCRQWMSLDSQEYRRNFMQVPVNRENARHDFSYFCLLVFWSLVGIFSEWCSDVLWCTAIFGILYQNCQNQSICRYIL